MQEERAGIRRMLKLRTRDASGLGPHPILVESEGSAGADDSAVWAGVEQKGYHHVITLHTPTESEFLPRAHRVLAPRNRWLRGTHRQAVKSPRIVSS